jgi:hypothetical protein
MTKILQHAPGQLVNLILETMDGYTRSDSYTIPVVSRIFLPNLTLATGYPQSMTKLDTGLYWFGFTLPSLATSVGTYIADVKWQDPATDGYANEAYQIIVSAPFGRYGITPG